jgi:diguanylate cyclase (GGDEF)-like protein/PAS domain S-box-containing protein
MSSTVIQGWLRKVAYRYYELRKPHLIHTFFQQTREAILLVSAKWQIIDANPASKKLFGLDEGMGKGQNLMAFLIFDPELDERFLFNASRTGVTSERHCIRADGMAIDLEISVAQVRGGKNAVYSLLLYDITAHKKMETALKTSEERYRLAAEGANDGLWDWNLMSGEIFFSARWKATLGYEEGEIAGMPEEWFDRIHPEDLLHFKTQLSNHLSNQTNSFLCDYRIKHKDGKYRWVSTRGVAIWNPAGYAERIAGSQTDMTERREVEERLRFDALHDTLTHLGNRTLLMDHLRNANERKKRRADFLYGLFFLDIDHFKQVNDSLGHQSGDQLLVEVAHRLEEGLRSTDTVSRFSGLETLSRIAGDEFVILLEDFSTVQDIHRVAGRISNLLSTPITIYGKEVQVTASIGLVVPDRSYSSVEDVIRDADIAMYHAKQSGGGQVVCFNEEMYEQIILRMELENDMRRAIDRQEFEVYYQPIYGMGNDRLVGFEALVRWNHPKMGLLLPADFLKIAEETGLIIPIGTAVLRAACKQMQLWEQQNAIFPRLSVGVNFSARQVLNDHLVETVEAILAETDFDPHCLWIEVTESIFNINDGKVRQNLNALRTMGIRVEIDDFGTGFTSLSYLKNLPIDGLKIDQSFLADFQESDQQILKAIVDLGHNLGLVEVAEGIETEKQHAFLKSLSCDYAQGYLLARPSNADQTGLLLSSMA